MNITNWIISVINHGGARVIQVLFCFFCSLALKPKHHQKVKWIFNKKFWSLFWLAVLSYSIIRMFSGEKQYFSSGYAIYAFLCLYSLYFSSSIFDDMKAWGISIALTLITVSTYECLWQLVNLLKRIWAHKIISFLPFVTLTHMYVIVITYHLLKNIIKIDGWKKNRWFTFFVASSVIFNVAFLFYWQIYWRGVSGIPIFWPLSRIGKILPVLAAIMWVRGLKK